MADLLVHDAQYSTEEYKTHAGFLATRPTRRPLRWPSRRRVKSWHFSTTTGPFRTDIDGLIEEAMGNYRSAAARISTPSRRPRNKGPL